MIGERTLSSLTEDREPRHLLDTAYDGGAVDNCLEQAQWHFAMRTVQIDYDPGYDPDFGYRRVFTKPTDWIITSAICSDEYFRVPLTQYSDEAGLWYADEEIIYVRYVSNDASYGGNLNAWPISFCDFAAAHLASKIAMKIGGADMLNAALALREKHLKTARNRAAMALPTSFPAQGSWSLARQRFPGNRDGGNRGGSLIG